ncbi:MAG: hypothetical protein WD595_01185 [Waddliaceae bacterium]
MTSSAVNASPLQEAQDWGEIIKGEVSLNKEKTKKLNEFFQNQLLPHLKENGQSHRNVPRPPPTPPPKNESAIAKQVRKIVKEQNPFPSIPDEKILEIIAFGYRAAGGSKKNKLVADALQKNSTPPECKNDDVQKLTAEQTQLELQRLETQLEKFRELSKKQWESFSSQKEGVYQPSHARELQNLSNTSIHRSQIQNRINELFPYLQNSIDLADNIREKFANVCIHFMYSDWNITSSSFLANERNALRRMIRDVSDLTTTINTGKATYRIIQKEGDPGLALEKDLEKWIETYENLGKQIEELDDNYLQTIEKLAKPLEENEINKEIIRQVEVISNPQLRKEVAEAMASPPQVIRAQLKGVLLEYSNMWENLRKSVNDLEVQINRLGYGIKNKCSIPLESLFDAEKKGFWQKAGSLLAWGGQKPEKLVISPFTIQKMKEGEPVSPQNIEEGEPASAEKPEEVKEELQPSMLP